jgi:hypothetical protein
MYGYITEAPIWSVVAFVGMFIIVRFLSRRLLFSDLDSLGVMNLTVVLSVTLLTAFAATGEILFSDFATVLFMALSFYAGLFLVGRYSGKPLPMGPGANAVRVAFQGNTLNNVNMVLLAAFFVFLNVYGFRELMTLGPVSGGGAIDERQLVFKEHREIDVLLRGLNVVLPFYAIGVYLVARRKWVLVVILIAAASGAALGGKSFLLSWVIPYFTLDGILVRRRSVFQWLKQFNVALLSLGGAFLLLVLWGVSETDAYWRLVDRIFATGDLYYYSLVKGDFHRLFHQYNFFSYLFHPFTAIIGIRGYEWPIGSAIIGTAGFPITGYGPNPHLPILLLVLLDGRIWLAALVSIVFGVAVGLARVGGLRLLAKGGIPAFWKIAAFALLIGGAPVIYADIEAFQFALLGVAAIIPVMTVLDELLSIAFRKRQHAMVPAPASRGTGIRVSSAGPGT